MTMIGMQALHDPPAAWPQGRYIKQRFARASQRPEELARELAAQLSTSSRLGVLAPGSRIGIGVGSRGLTNLQLVVRTVVDHIRGRGFEPVILPAMGSHGGATSEGQREVLAEYGITEETMGAPIESDVSTEILGRDGDGRPVHFSSVALHAVDAVIPINRIKLHTDFRGPVESGLSKMLVIGLGKQAGAEATHALGMPAFTTAIPERARMITETINVPVGIALVENGLKETVICRSVEGDRLVEAETELLVEATRQMPRLPFDHADLLVIERMGKDISGPGCDPNVFGRYLTAGMSGGPSVKRIGCLDLTPASHGNAVGIGQLDTITKRLFDDIDFVATYTNLLTSGGLEYAAVPMVAASDRDLVLIGIAGAYVPLETARIAVIDSTAHLEHLWVSDSLLAEMDADAVELGPWEPLAFDASGTLRSRASAAPSRFESDQQPAPSLGRGPTSATDLGDY